MEVKVLDEFGYDIALYGIGLSYGITSNIHSIESFKDPQNKEVYNKLQDIAINLAKKGHAEDKFLRQICVYLSIKAPLYWWKQADTYKVGTTA